MTVPLLLAGDDDDWRLHLNGDWSLAAMAPIEAQLKNLPGGLPDTLREVQGLVADVRRTTQEVQ
jgi:hypothetical protein